MRSTLFIEQVQAGPVWMHPHRIAAFILSAPLKYLYEIVRLLSSACEVCVDFQRAIVIVFKHFESWIVFLVNI